MRLLFFVLCLAYQVGYTQTLQPRTYANGSDTLFAFTRIQLRALTRLIVKGQYDAQALTAQAKIIDNQEQSLAAKDGIILNLSEAVQLKTEQITLRDSLLEAQKAQLKAEQQRLSEQLQARAKADRKARRRTRWGLGLAVLTLILGTQL